MTIERWDPFREMVSLRDAMNSLLAESFVRPGGPPATGGAATLPLDVAETEGEFVIKASLPGIKPEDVHITVHGDTLTIRGESKAEEEKKGAHWHVRERRVSSLVRSLSLGTPINADAANRPVRSRRLDADLAQDGGGQAEADQGGERPDAAPVERSSGSSRSGARYVRHRQRGHPPIGRRSRAGSPSRPHDVAAAKAARSTRPTRLATPWRRAGSSRLGEWPLLQTVSVLSMKGECRNARWLAITFAILALLAGLLGFVALAGTLAMIAKVLLFVFLALFVISLIFGRRRRGCLIFVGVGKLIVRLPAHH